MRSFIKAFSNSLTYAILLGSFLSPQLRAEEVQTNSQWSSSTQMLLVLSKGWDDVPAVMQRYERKNADARWKKVGASIPVVVARNGMGWGRGINPEVSLDGPQKQEGDGRSPAGIFKLGEAFGLEASNSTPGIKLPYLQLNPEIECVDDVKSRHYNTIVSRSAQPVDWDSSEHMKDVGEQYRLGVVVQHNSDPVQNGGGSCIFIHIWKSSTNGTSGCTAMEPKNINKVVTWLDPNASPVLVQMPKAQYEILKKGWELP